MFKSHTFVPVWPGTWHTGSSVCCPHCCSGASELRRNKRWNMELKMFLNDMKLSIFVLQTQTYPEVLSPTQRQTWVSVPAAGLPWPGRSRDSTLRVKLIEISAVTTVQPIRDSPVTPAASGRCSSAREVAPSPAASATEHHTDRTVKILWILGQMGLAADRFAPSAVAARPARRARCRRSRRSSSRWGPTGDPTALAWQTSPGGGEGGD